MLFNRMSNVKSLTNRYIAGLQPIPRDSNDKDAAAMLGMGVQTIEANYKSFVNDPQLTSLANHQYVSMIYFMTGCSSEQA